MPRWVCQSPMNVAYAPTLLCALLPPLAPLAPPRARAAVMALDDAYWQSRSARLQVGFEVNSAALDEFEAREQAYIDRLRAVGERARALEAELREIHNGMLYLRAREAELRDLNEATNTRVAWLSCVSLAVCISLCVWQIYYLKNFFQRKKLL